MQEDLKRYLTFNDSEGKQFKVHNMKTSHSKALTRFLESDDFGLKIINTSPLKYEVLIEKYNKANEEFEIAKKTGDKLKIKKAKTSVEESKVRFHLSVFLNAKEDKCILAKSTITQYLRVLAFYGLIPLCELEKYDSFQLMFEQLAKNDEYIKFVKMHKNQFIDFNFTHLISGNISLHLKSKKNYIVDNAKGFLSAIYILNWIEEKKFDLNEENIEEFYKENDFNPMTLKEESNYKNILEAVKSFEEGPFDMDKNFYLKIIRGIRV